MNEGRSVIFDLEANDLLRGVTTIHCLSYQFEDETEVKSITDPERIKKFFQQKDVTYIGHNIIVYDIPVAKKLLGVSVPYVNCIDTLAISWNLYDDRLKHGLADWGVDLGVAKPKIDDWENLSIEEYVHRCEEDVKINFLLWKKEKELLLNLYEGDLNQIEILLKYLSFKLDCIREQEEEGLHLDIPLIESGIKRLTKLSEEKVDRLKQIMPKIPKISTKKKPAKFLNVNGEVTKIGQTWLNLLKEKGIPENYEGTVEYITDYEEPNPNSVQQKKDWLYSLGWVPEHIKYVRDKKTNKVTEIPQIVGKIDKTEVCPSIKKLFEKEPGLEDLNGLGIINHRLGILKGFLRDQIDGKIYPSVSSIASTMRMKHKVVVNAPAYNAPYAEEIRASIIAPEGYKLLGYDLKSAEDTTKRHFLFDYDPDYVAELNDPNYSPHTDISVLAGLMTKEEEEFYKKVEKMEDRSILTEEEMKNFKRLKDVRHKGKTTNFSATYFIGSQSLARALDIPKKEAQKILDAYWEKNKAIKEYCENCKVKEVDGRNWILNEVSNFWLPLRADKDRLSATNQSTAVYVFDTWVMFMRIKYGIKVLYQAHDEGISCVSDNYVEDCKSKIFKAMVDTNNKIKLNVEMGCSVEVGMRYSECH